MRMNASPSSMVRIRNVTRAFAFSHLRGAHRQRHGQAAANQHRGVDGADGDVQHVASRLETGQVEVAIDGVAGEEPAEEHDLGGQENPHAEAGGLVLLLQVLELVRQRARGVTVSQLTSFE